MNESETFETLVTAVRSLSTIKDEETIPCTEETISRAIVFLRNSEHAIMSAVSITGLPKIGLGPNGSVDFCWYWNPKEMSLLVNFPADENAPITYTGSCMIGYFVSLPLGILQNK